MFYQESKTVKDHTRVANFFPVKITRYCNIFSEKSHKGKGTHVMMASYVHPAFLQTIGGLFLFVRLNDFNTAVYVANRYF